MLFDAEFIKVKKDDDAEFIRLINKINSVLVWQYQIDELHYVYVKNWFDHKWLNYSGKAVIYDDTPLELEPQLTNAALENKWQEQVTVPPFHPDRILSESLVRRKRTNNHMIEKRLHVYQSSNNNLHNRIMKYSQNGLFVWYSSHSKINQRGSFMVYRVQNDNLETFYASFENNQGWTITQSKGIGLNELKVYLDESRP